MDPDVKKLLEANLKLTKENNELLKKVRGFQKWSQITRFMYWFVIIGIAVGSFYFIQPYFSNILNIYSGGVSDINAVKNIGETLNMESLGDILNGRN